MKTSSKLLLIALSILCLSLTWYDLRLKAEYDKGDYKNPFWDFTPADFRGFDTVDLRSATALNIYMVQGPFKVLASPEVSDFLKISQQGRTLRVEAEFVDHYRAFPDNYALFISCPNLALFRSAASYRIGRRTVTDTIARDFAWRPTLIKNFTLDSLQIVADEASNLVLDSNHIQHLEAVVGVSNHTGPRLTIGEGNRFKGTNLLINYNSILWLHTIDSNHLSYRLADQAGLLLDGKVANSIIKTKAP
jgi:hypothetical protein